MRSNFKNCNHDENLKGYQVVFEVMCSAVSCHELCRYNLVVSIKNWGFLTIFPNSRPVIEVLSKWLG